MKKPHHSFLIMFLIVLCSLTMVWAGTQNQNSSYRLPITRNGKTQTRLAYYYWSSEYPRPVIDVNSQVNGKTTVQAYGALRTLDQKVSCTITNGIYHPWSKTKNSVINYYSLAPVDDYKALTNAEVGGVKVNAGDLITNVVYASEGICVGHLRDKQEIDFECATVSDKQGVFQNISGGDANFAEQWLYLACDEGHKAFIQDSVLLKANGVSEGTIVGYGVVGPQTKTP